MTQAEKIVYYESRRQIEEHNSLITRMMKEAEPIVKHYWTDVCIHDKRVLNSMEPNSSAVWVIYEMGSFLCPLYSSIDFCEPILPTICYLIAADTKTNDILGRLSDYHFYFLTKGINCYHGDFWKVSRNDLIDFLYPANSQCHQH
jgi:hypothetical protein